MGGGWRLLDWTSAGTVLMIGSARRDTLPPARNGRCLAFGPDLGWPTGSPWVGCALDPLGAMLSTGTAAVRLRLEDRTVADGVYRIRAGEAMVADHWLWRQSG